MGSMMRPAGRIVRPNKPVVSLQPLVALHLDRRAHPEGVVPLCRSRPSYVWGDQPRIACIVVFVVWGAWVSNLGYLVCHLVGKYPWTCGRIGRDR